MQGTSLGDGERADAEPFVRQAAPELRGTAQPDPEHDRVRVVPTTVVTSSEDLLVPPTSILRCEQPTAGQWESRSSSQSGCIYEDAAGAMLTAPPIGSENPQGVRLAAPDSPAMDGQLPSSRDRGGEAVGRAAGPARAVQVAAVNDQAPRLGTSLPATPAPSSSPDASRLAAPEVNLLGRWYPNAKECSKRGAKSDCLPLVIGQRSAKAGTASCQFLRKQQDGPRVNVVARCVNAGETWTANIRLVLAGKRLTWTSERGSQDYVR